MFLIGFGIGGPGSSNPTSPEGRPGSNPPLPPTQARRPEVGFNLKPLLPMILGRGSTSSFVRPRTHTVDPRLPTCITLTMHTRAMLYVGGMQQRSTPCQRTTCVRRCVAACCVGSVWSVCASRGHAAARSTRRSYVGACAVVLLAVRFVRAHARVPQLGAIVPVQKSSSSIASSRARLLARAAKAEAAEVWREEEPAPEPRPSRE